MRTKLLGECIDGVYVPSPLDDSKLFRNNTLTDTEGLPVVQFKEAMLAIQDIFNDFNGACKYIVFVHTATSTIALCFLIFFVYGYLGRAGGSVLFQTNLYTFAVMILFGFSVLKIWILVNVGEDLLQNSKTLQVKVACMPFNYNWLLEGEMLLHLKQIAETINFQLSACGFFKVDRGTITSVFSAVITYTIVIFQMGPNAKLVQ
ncbi:unnamed protein product [Allacma fusca]|uniref:Uncharacterized protein n=1 Tax=Allacma fusca TaxID=39272 RepID=A0A8J2L6F4_9HEXA|nr:unnamed protein product [Allacma fusca]